MLDFCLAVCIIFYFWYFLESIHKFIIELHVLQSLFLRRCNKKQRRCRIISNFTKGEIFPVLWQPSGLAGNLTMWLPFFGPSKKDLPFLFSLAKNDSVHRSIKAPFKKHHLLHSFLLGWFPPFRNVSPPFDFPLPNFENWVLRLLAEWKFLKVFS